MIKKSVVVYLNRRIDIHLKNGISKFHLNSKETFQTLPLTAYSLLTFCRKTEGYFFTSWQTRCCIRQVTRHVFLNTSVKPQDTGTFLHTCSPALTESAHEFCMNVPVSPVPPSSAASIYQVCKVNLCRTPFTCHAVDSSPYK